MAGTDNVCRLTGRLPPSLLIMLGAGRDDRLAELAVGTCCDLGMFETLYGQKVSTPGLPRCRSQTTTHRMTVISVLYKGAN